MAQATDQTAKTQLMLPLPGAVLGVLAAVSLALPSTGLALVGLGSDPTSAPTTSDFGLFAPASVDPEFAAQIADKARERGIQFTPVGASAVNNDRTVTVAVRMDADIARAVSVRQAAQAAPGTGTAIIGLQANRFDLGAARGYQSFAQSQPEITDTPVSGRAFEFENVRDLSLPDLSAFEPAQPTREDRPSRLQPRIELEGETIAGRSPNTLDAIGAQTVDVGGSFSLSRNLDVTAGVRYSQERERLDPLTNSLQDSQAVYVGTQIRF